MGEVVDLNDRRLFKAIMELQKLMPWPPWPPDLLDRVAAVSFLNQYRDRNGRRLKTADIRKIRDILMENDDG